jgi:hypothetical protein
LPALVHVVAEQGITELDVLMTTYRAEVKRAIRRLLPPRVWIPTTKIFVKVLRTLGYPGCGNSIQRIDPPDWPPTLRKQFERFLKLAPQGINHDLALVKRAAEHRVVVPLEESTVKRYIDALSIGLGFILPRYVDARDDLDVRDLLRSERVGMEGDELLHVDGVNPLIEPYRSHERERSTRAKRAGYDSCSFLFLTMTDRSTSTGSPI